MIVPVSVVSDKTVVDSDYQALYSPGRSRFTHFWNLYVLFFFKQVTMFLCLRELFVQEKQCKFLIFNIFYCFASELYRKTLTSAATTK